MEIASSVLLRVYILFLLAASGVAFSRLKCRDPLRPVWNSSVAVRRHGRSPFQLSLTSDTGNSSRDGGQFYRVEIASKNPLLQFAAVQLAVIKTETCGHGWLRLNRSAFHQEEAPSRGCPMFLFTKSSQRLQELPLLMWRPPSCGCVQFRALVFEDDTGFYSDDRGESNGYLTHTVCVRKQEDRQTYLTALCRVRARYSPPEIVSRPSFAIRHGITGPEKRAASAVLEARQARLAHCCDKSTTASKEKCLQRARFHRVDRFCEDGIPEISFTTLRQEFMRKQEKRCCFIMGSHRYACFSYKANLPANSTEASILDFSLDECDPLNDLADILTSQDTDIVHMLTRLEFSAVFESDSDQLELRDGGSKQAASGERSSRSSSSLDSRQILDNRQMQFPASTENLDGRQNLDDRPVEVQHSDSRRDQLHARLQSQVQLSGIQQPGRSQLPVRYESGAAADAKDQAGDFSAPLSPQEAPPPSRTISRELSKSRRRKPDRSSSSRRGRNRGRNSQGRRSSGQRRRPGGGSRDSRPRRTSRRRSGSRERRRKGQAQYSTEQPWQVDSHAPASYPDSIEEEGGISDAEVIEQRLTRKENRLRMRRVCCQKGLKHGHLLTDYQENLWQECSLRARQLSDSVVETQGDRLANACYRQYRQCCTRAVFRGADNHGSIGSNTAQTLLDRVGGARKALERVGRARGAAQRGGGASDINDERGAELRLGQGWTKRHGAEDLIDSYDKESERRFQHMRNSQQPRADGEEEDGPARFDKLDNGQEGDRQFDLDIEESSLSRPVESIVQSLERGRSRPATEEIGDFDDRDFVDGREDDEEGEEEEDEEGDDGEEGNEEDEDNEEEEEEKEEDRHDLDQQGRQTSKRQGWSSRRTSGSKRRNSRGDGGMSSRRRNRSRGSRGNRSMRKRDYNRSRTSRRNRSRERSSRNRGRGYRTLGGNGSRTSRRQSGRSSRRTSGSYRDYTRGYRDMRGAGRRAGRRRGQLVATLDSKEQAEAHQKLLQQFPRSPIEAYYS